MKDLVILRPARLRKSYRLLISVLFVCYLVSPDAFAQQQTPTPTPSGDTLAKIEFVGLQRIAQEEALAATGLQIGQVIDADMVDQAAGRLVETGLFKKLSYNLRTAKGQASIVFKVEEMSSYAPVVFDNFVWFSDRELNEYVSKNVPGFDGAAPQSGTQVETITRVLNDLLRLRGIEGHVEYTPSADLSGRNPEHVFTVKGPSMNICSISYPGASAVKEETLRLHSGGLLFNEYSRQFLRLFAESKLMPFYRERGLLRAAFRTPTAKPLAEGGECSGVAVTMPVDEGTTYVWERAEWSGNESITSAELDAALGMRPREIANGSKLEKGIEAVRKAYGRKGHLAARLSVAPSFDDTARSMSYRVSITEGPQYRMGELTITGLSEKDTNNLKGRWNLLPREVYDAEYAKEFLDKTMKEFLRDPATETRALGLLKAETSVKLDREKLAVDVTINFSPQPRP